MVTNDDDDGGLLMCINGYQWLLMMTMVVY